MPNPKYFQNFPTYNANIDGVERTITDITPAIHFSQYMLEKSFPFYDYVIQDGERPDHVSFKHYKDSKYYWIILVTNGIQDVWRDWPMDTNTLNHHISSLYGSVTQAKSTIVKYYNIEDNIEIDYTTFQDSPSSVTDSLSAYDYEVEMNERKRYIKLIQPRYISQAQSELKQLFQ